MHWFPLGRIEVLLCFIVWVVHSFGAFIISWQVSSGKLQQWLYYWTEPSGYLDGFRIDNSDYEWRLYRLTCLNTFLIQSLHSLVFHVVVNCCYKSLLSRTFLILFWLAIHLYWTSVDCLLILSAFAFIVIVATYYVRHQALAWIMTLLFIVIIPNYAHFSPNHATYYREFNLYLYTAIQILNYAIHLTRKDPSPSKWSKEFTAKHLIEFLEYLLYPPYSVALIIVYGDFRSQFDNIIMHDFTKKLRIWLRASLRLFFWMIFLDAALHFVHVNAPFNAPFVPHTVLNNYELSAIAYTAGQLFNVKYVVIFGMQSMFAEIDGMTPPRPPICISRVSNYSLMWRNFDRGLYQFLKQQVYIPLMGQRSSQGRRLAASVAVFLFVLIWHGIQSSNYAYWVALSALELCIERIGNDLILPSKTYVRLEYKLGMAVITRIKAVLMLFTVIPGIFGIFFFLGRAGFGEHIFKQILMKGLLDIITLRIHWLNPGFVLLHLFFIGYFFNIVCLFLTELLDERRIANNRGVVRERPD